VLQSGLYCMFCMCMVCVWWGRGCYVVEFVDVLDGMCM
jgi:hypothetical protein